MHPTRRIARTGAIACLLVLLLVAPSPVRAQGSGTNAPFGESERLDLDFPGGDISSYVDAIHKAVGRSMIVVMPGAEGVAVPRVRLTGVPVRGAIGVLQGYEQSSGAEGTQVYVRESDGVFVVGAEHFDASKNLKASVWSIEEIVDPDMPADDVLAAVQTAMSTYENPARVKFHVETGLLIARGRPDQLSMINDVLDSLQESAQAKRIKRERGSYTDQLELELRKAELRVRSESELLELAERRHEKIAQQHEQGVVDIDDVLSAEHDVIQQRLAIEEAQIDVEHLRKMLDRAEGGTGG